jgi:hypothetical protein
LVCAFPVAAQITDPARWLVQARCAAGNSPDHRQSPAPQRITDPVYYSRHDWPTPTGYCFSHNTIGTDASFVQNFRFADGGFGGQALHINDNAVLAYKTQTPARTELRRTGWIMFDVDVPKGQVRVAGATIGG